ncbi:MAG: hypothetical protein E3K36_00680 [Candidatus Brocadia sp.]|nr:hypothetical protein [Candidatus Brocadia sp.]
MDKLPKQIIAEKEYVEMALNNLKTALARRGKTVIELFKEMSDIFMQKDLTKQTIFLNQNTM